MRAVKGESSKTFGGFQSAGFYTCNNTARNREPTQLSTERDGHRLAGFTSFLVTRPEILSNILTTI